MANPLQKKWFAAIYTARIALKKVDHWAEFHKQNTPYFDTWEEAHAHSLDIAKTKLERAKCDLKSAERHLERVKLLKAPNA